MHELADVLIIIKKIDIFEITEKLPFICNLMFDETVSMVLIST